MAAKPDGTVEQVTEAVREADQQTVWEGFGREMADAATSHPQVDGSVIDDDELQWAGFRLNVAASRFGYLGRGVGETIHPEHRQFGGSKEGLLQNAVAQEAEYYAVIRLNQYPTVDVVRESVVEALER